MNLAMRPSRLAELLSDPTLVARVERIVRKRVTDDDVAADIVQEAFAAAQVKDSTLPRDDAAARKYLFGIVRNKIRMALREWRRRTHDPFDEEIHGMRDPPAFEAREIVRKVIESIAPRRFPTFVWFLRVAFGDSLADIAREEGVEYGAAHARYLRMRNDLRRRVTELTAVAVAVLLAFGIVRAVGRRGASSIRPDPSATPSGVRSVDPPATPGRANLLRQAAFHACDNHAWVACLGDLDEARLIDPSGDHAPDVQGTRRTAEQALARPVQSEKGEPR